MRNLLTNAMVVTVGLCLLVAVVAFGAVTSDLAAPVYGLALVATVCWAVKLLLADVVTWKKSPMHLPVLAFLVYATVRYFASPIEYESRLELFDVWLCGLVYFLVASNLYHSRHRAVLMGLLVALAVLEAIYGIWQFATRAETALYLQRPQMYFHRGGGTFMCPNHLAGFLEMILGLVLGNIALRRVSSGSAQRGTLAKVFWAYAAVVMMAGIVTTLSRAGWISTAIGVLVVFLWGDWRAQSMWPRIAVALLSVAVLAFITFRIQPARDYISLTMRSGTESEVVKLKDPSLGGRTLLWKAAWDMFRSHPIVGTGAGTWEWMHLKYRDPQVQGHAEYAHNDILNLASDYGSIGFGIVLAALLCFYWQASVVAKSDPSSEHRSFATGAILAVTVILVHSWFDFNLHVLANALVLAAILGLTVAIEEDPIRFPRVKMKRSFRFALAGFLLALATVGAWSFGRTALATRYTELGLAAKRALDWDTATNHFHRAIALDPGFAEPYRRLGDTLHTQSEWRLDPARSHERKALARDALQLYQQSLALNPYQSEAYLRTARLLEILDQDDQALKAYEQVLAIDPNNAFIYLRLGFRYRRVALPFSESDFTNLAALADQLRRQSDPVSRFLWSQFSEPARRVLTDTNSTLEQRQSVLVGDLNKILQGKSIYDAQRFAAVSLSEKARGLITQELEGDKLTLLNRLLLEDAYPTAITKSRRIETSKKAAEAFKRSAELTGSFDNLAWDNFTEVSGWL